MTDQTKYRLNEITKIENYFNQEINKKTSCSKKLSKHIATFEYIDNILIVLPATSGGVCIISSVSVVGAPIGMAGTRLFCVNFFLTTGIIKKLLSIKRNKKKKHYIILMLA